MNIHYSQQNAEVHVDSALMAPSGKVGVANIRVSGFISLPVLREELEKIFLGESESSASSTTREIYPDYSDPLRPKSAIPDLVLCDMRDLTGYGAGVPALLRESLEYFQGGQSSRIALVANSAVLRTAVRVLESELALNIRCFLTPRAALSWLHEGHSPSKHSTSEASA